MAGSYSRFGSNERDYFRQLITGGDIDMQPEEAPGIMARSRFAGRRGPVVMDTAPEQPEAPDMSFFESFARALGRSSDDPERVADAVLGTSQPVRPTGGLGDWDSLPPAPDQRVDETRAALGSAVTAGQQQNTSESTLPSNIDFSFIGQQEGDESSMYVPMSQGRAIDSSGPTIGMGVDLGQRTAEELEGLPEDLRRKLAPYTNMKGQEAVNFVRQNPLTLTDEEREIINSWSKQEETNRLIALWERDSEIPWEDLTRQQATAVASVMYQYGSYRVRTPNFWRKATSGDWTGVEQELRNFGDKYGPRRTREANYLAGN